MLPVSLGLLADMTTTVLPAACLTGRQQCCQPPAGRKYWQANSNEAAKHTADILGQMQLFSKIYFEDTTWYRPKNTCHTGFFPWRAFAIHALKKALRAI